MESQKLRRALISVSDKLGLVDFARGLADAGVEIYSTGGTRKHLENAGLEVRDISAYTEFPEMMDGRLKTLHPKVFGGILCRHDRPDDMAAIGEHGIDSFELVVVNLYPFEATIAREGVTRGEAIEQVDIGGPSLVRAAAKNHAFVSIVTDPEQYSAVLDEIVADGRTTLETRERLAAEAFARTAAYDRAIADYFRRRNAGWRITGHDECDAAAQGRTSVWRKPASNRGVVFSSRTIRCKPCRGQAVEWQGAVVQQSVRFGCRPDNRAVLQRTGCLRDQTQQSLRRGSCDDAGRSNSKGDGW